MAVFGARRDDRQKAIEKRCRGVEAAGATSFMPARLLSGMTFLSAVIPLTALAHGRLELCPRRRLGPHPFNLVVASEKGHLAKATTEQQEAQV